MWGEGRPGEGGRIQLVRRVEGEHADRGTVTDLLPADANARTGVHEYGGGAWWLHDGAVFAVDWADQRLRRYAPDAEPVVLTPEPTVPRGDRFADGDVAPDGTWLVCVREHHPREGAAATEVVNEIVRLDAREPSEPGGAGHRAGLRRRPASVAGRRPARLGLLGPPVDAVGRHGAHRARPRDRHRDGRRRRARRVGRGAGARQADSALHFLSERAPAVVEPLPLAPRRRRDPARRHGRRDRAARLAAGRRPPRDALTTGASSSRGPPTASTPSPSGRSTAR